MGWLRGKRQLAEKLFLAYLTGGLQVGEGREPVGLVFGSFVIKPYNSFELSDSTLR